MSEEKTNLLHEARNDVNKELYVEALNKINIVIKEHPNEWEAYILAIRCYTQNFHAGKRCLRYENLIDKLCNRIAAYVDENHLAQAQAYMKRTKDYLRKYKLQESIEKCQKEIEERESKLEMVPEKMPGNSRLYLFFAGAAILFGLGLWGVINFGSRKQNTLLCVIFIIMMLAGVGALAIGLVLYQKGDPQKDERNILEQMKQEKESMQQQWDQAYGTKTEE